MKSAPNDATLLPAAVMLMAAQWPTPETVNSSKNNKGVNADKVTDASHSLGSYLKLVKWQLRPRL